MYFQRKAHMGFCMFKLFLPNIKYFNTFNNIYKKTYKNRKIQIFINSLKTTKIY